MGERTITNNLVSTNLSIVFYVDDLLNNTVRFTKSLSNISADASEEDIYAAAEAISKLYEFNRYDVKLISTNIIENTEEVIEEEIPVSNV